MRFLLTKFNKKHCIIFLTLNLLLLILLNPSKAQDELHIVSIDQSDLKYWHKFQTFTAKNLDLFVKNNHELLKAQSVLYAFGGADILYPIMLFPNAVEITLIGLENIGSNSLILKDNKHLKISSNVVSLLQRSFMVTERMQQTFSREHAGVYQAFLEQLSLLGIDSVFIEEFDSVRQTFTITFTYQNLQRKISYYKLNVINEKFPSLFLATLREQKKFDSALLKATSYALHQKQFSQIKHFIMDNASIIVQDDSGIPLFDIQDLYNIKKFGSYTNPYGKEFVIYDQPKLREKQSENTIMHPICFGYGCGRQSVLILIAIKK